MVTERIRLGTMLTPVPRRRPWELAGQTMTVDRLSNGRVILSAGLGVAAEIEQRFWIFEDDPGRKRARRAARRGARAAAAALAGASRSSTRASTTAPSAPTRCCRPRSCSSRASPPGSSGVWPRMKSMRRVARYDGWIPNYAPPGADAIDPLEQQRTYTPEIAAEAIAWIRAERERLGLADRPFDIVQEGTTAASTGWRMPRSCARGPTPASRGGSSPTGTCRPSASPSTRASACARGRRGRSASRHRRGIRSRIRPAPMLCA